MTNGTDTAAPAAPIRIGIVGTSWWVDAMYLPALCPMDGVEVVALAGRSPGKLAALAGRWGVGRTYHGWQAMLEHADLDGVVIAATNEVHPPASIAALERGVAVLCEKPLANSVTDAVAMAEAADDSGLPTMVAFTYGFMPGFRWLERLVADGYVGRVHHLRLQYHTGFGLDGGYSWRFDRRRNPSGILADLGSHLIHLSHRLAGPIRELSADLRTIVSRPPTDPDGEAYDHACDSAALMMTTEGGAQVVLHCSAVGYEGTQMDQRHVIEVHGDQGTLTYLNDWDTVQEVRGTQVGEGPLRTLPIPEEIWGGVRRERVHDTYRDVFRTTDAMARGWARAVAAGRPTSPDLAEGLAVQQVLDAALRSDAAGLRVPVERGTP